MNNLKLDLCLDIQDIEVKFTLVDKGDLMAIFALLIGDLTIKGFRLQKSQFQDPITRTFWITPPVYFGKDKKAHPIVFIDPKEKWDELKKHIMEKYDEAVDKQYFSDIDDDVKEAVKAIDAI